MGPMVVRAPWATKPPPELKAKAAERARLHLGSKRSPESRARMREAQQAIFQREREQGIKRKHPPRSEEALRNMSEAQKGKTWTDAQRAKMTTFRENLPQETREKLRAAVLARPQAQRDEWARSQKGKPKSPETRAKMSEARKKYWESLTPEERALRKSERKH